MTIMNPALHRGLFSTSATTAEQLWWPDILARTLLAANLYNVIVAASGPADTTALWWQPSATNAAPGVFSLWSGSAWIPITPALFKAYTATVSVPAANSITNAMLAQSAAATLKGNLTVGVANESDNTMSAVAAALVADTGANATLKGALGPAGVGTLTGTGVGDYTLIIAGAPNASYAQSAAAMPTTPTARGYAGTWSWRAGITNVSDPGFGAQSIALWQRVA